MSKSTPNLRLVSKIPQQYKNIVFGFVKEVQLLFPIDQSSYFNIVDLIKHLILLYFYATFESSILNDQQEKDKFIDFLRSNNKLSIVDHPWKLIYESKKQGLKMKNFVENVHDHPNVLLLIELKKECIIGGYTSTGWDKSINRYTWTGDKHAFVFYFKNRSKTNDVTQPFISNIKQLPNDIKNAIGHDHECYGCLGKTWIFYFYDNRFHQQSNTIKNSCRLFQFNSQLADRIIFLTGDRCYHGLSESEIQMEAFQIEM